MTLAELVIKMSADTAGLRQDFYKATSMAQQVGNDIKRIFSTAWPAISIGGILKEFYDLADSAGKVGSEIFKAMQISGMGAEELSSLRVVSKQTSESFEGLSTTMARAGKNITAGFIDPASAAGKLLGALFSKIEVQSLKLAPVPARLQEITKRIFDLADAQERDFAAAIIFGKGWMQNVETLQKLGREGFDPLIAQARTLGQVFSEEDARTAHEFEVGVNNLKLAFEGLTLSMGIMLDQWATGVNPALSEFAERIDKIQATRGILPKDFLGGEGIKDIGAELARQAKEQPSNLSKLTDAWQEWENTLKVVGSHAKKITAGFPEEIFAGIKTPKVGGRLADLMAKPEKPDPEAERRRKQLSEWFTEIRNKILALNQGDIAAALAKLTQLGAGPNQLAAARELLKRFDDLKLRQDLLKESFHGVGKAWEEEFAAVLRGVEQYRAKIESMKETAAGMWAAVSEGLSKVDTVIDQAMWEKHEAAMESLRNHAKAFGAEMSGALSQMIVYGRGFRDMLDSVLEMLVKLVLQTLIFKNLASAFSGGGFFSKIIGGLFSGLAGLQGGGSFSAGEPILVGERGPELAMFNRAGNIIPNNRLGGIVIENIDARGADAGVEYRVKRGVQAAMATAAVNGYRLTMEMARRS